MKKMSTKITSITSLERRLSDIEKYLRTVEKHLHIIQERLSVVYVAETKAALPQKGPIGLQILVLDTKKIYCLLPNAQEEASWMVIGKAREDNGLAEAQEKAKLAKV